MSGRRLDWDGFRVFTPERTWSIAWLLVRRAIRSFSDVRLWGRERIPKSGPVILASNHRSFYDIFVLGAAVKRPIHYMAKVELFEHPVLGRVLPHTGAFPVRRGEVDRGALEAAREVLERGGMLGIFIDGTRHHAGAVGEVRAGAAMLAGQTGAPIVPVYIHGTDRIVDDPRAPISIAFGRPFQIEGRGSKAYRAGADRLADKLRRLQAFTESAERAGRPRDAVPPEPSAAPPAEADPS
ncbi:MAG: lysophospholipid acyltransferase family protein [Actinomycetota bacterium]